MQSMHGNLRNMCNFGYRNVAVLLIACVCGLLLFYRCSEDIARQTFVSPVLKHNLDSSLTDKYAVE
jgi:hypothetical protein